MHLVHRAGLVSKRSLRGDAESPVEICIDLYNTRYSTRTSTHLLDRRRLRLTDQQDRQSAGQTDDILVVRTADVSSRTEGSRADDAVTTTASRDGSSASSASASPLPQPSATTKSSSMLLPPSFDYSSSPLQPLLVTEKTATRISLLSSCEIVSSDRTPVRFERNKEKKKTINKCEHSSSYIYHVRN